MVADREKLIAYLAAEISKQAANVGSGRVRFQPNEDSYLHWIPLSACKRDHRAAFGKLHGKRVIVSIQRDVLKERGRAPRTTRTQCANMRKQDPMCCPFIIFLRVDVKAGSQVDMQLHYCNRPHNVADWRGRAMRHTKGAVAKLAIGGSLFQGLMPRCQP